ncbi:xanthine dehydrogenase subunit D [Bacillus halotolerans]|uniref:xanthine dehydrogenase subunit D n=1 Tax=Bacillus halotolerans TaxID=260554 RepID=UPI000D03F6A4|nr:xanthine dehydrogenase subunit D [Bacillus halotolerans]PRS06591.1 xanthine dehydrogenase subunit D [Bacillus halotolerans]PRS25958.1 xanthine dehydrogenase subunit D [Bacillus halotolerans]QKS05881.1 xanthine dehydrogenase subunit D [Bacillus halotolerans]
MSVSKPSRIRPDGREKVTGELKYMTDLTFPGMLYGKILRSAYPHAEIVSICTKKAEEMEGVRAVVTHKDVPGFNRFGIVIPDQPVLCEDRVRYVGDAVAAVAAETEDIAEAALELIHVVYRELEVIDSPEKALRPDAHMLHPDGNILHRTFFSHGDVEAGFQSCHTILEETYELPRQMHTYMETEGGVAAPERDGGFTMYAGTQHGYKDRFQLARIFGIPEEKIRVVSSPMGGSFGGKDELNIQPYAALLARKSGCPVKIHQTRQESVRSGIKRHPMKITIKTGADQTGKLLAHDVKIIADTGAYATLGPAVLDFSVEHAAGPYRIPNIRTQGISVFTNNGVAGEFRGFGGNQITFALETHLDRLSSMLGIDPLELRRKNIRKPHDLGPLEHRIASTDGAAQVLNVISASPILKRKHQTSRYKRRGVGAAITMHGGGLGYGRMDAAGGRLSLSSDGKITASFGFEECGQGILAAIEHIVTEELGCAAEDISIIIGDTAKVPKSGSSTASRGTSMVWHAIQRLKKPFLAQLKKRAAQLVSCLPEQLILSAGGLRMHNTKDLAVTYKELAEKGPLTEETAFDFPTTPDPVVGGHFLYSFGAAAVEVEVDLLTGDVRVIDCEHAIAAGPVVSPQGYRGQIEGGAAMALGYTLMEEAKMTDGRYTAENLDQYVIPGIKDVPAMKLTAIEELMDGDSYGPRGVGEIGTIAITPAIVKAVHDAVGCWVNKLPISREELLDEIDRKGIKQWT